MIAQAFAGLLGFARRRFENVTFIAIDEDHVDVGAVVEFLATEFAEADSAKSRRLPTLVRIEMIGRAETLCQLLRADLVNGFQTNIGEVGQFEGDVHGVADTGRGRARRCEACRVV